jgi:hypothetical protein
MNPRYPVVARRAAHQCEYCRAPEAVFNLAFEVEHVLPPIHGGPDDESNWALSCRSCNVHKSDSIRAVDPDTGAEPRLFHPRRDQWHQHFQIEPSTGTMSGLTPVGRATISRLKMNSPAQLAARRQWMRLCWFPFP